MDKYYDYEAQKALPLSTQNNISNITFKKVTTLFSKVLHIVVEKVSCEEADNTNTSFTDIELKEVISE